MESGREVIIGIGNSYRGDDGVGIEIIRLLRGRLSDTVELIEHDGEVASLVELLGECSAVLIVDAVQSRHSVGELTFFDLSMGELPAESFRGSTHALGIEDALELCRSMETLPQRCMVVGVAGSDFGHQAQLSAELQGSLDHIVENVLQGWDTLKKGGKNA